MKLRNLALIPVLTLIISISVVLFLDLSEKLAFNPPYLLLALNLIFWTAATLAIAFVSAKSFLKEDSLIVLIISCSIIIFGLPVIISGWVQTFSVNKSIALSNPCILVASILQLIGGILAFQGKQETKASNRKRLLATVYLASVILVLANLTVALLGYYPPFFLASGPTLLRQAILGLSIFFFAVAAIVFGAQYLRAKSPSLYWYALAIGLFSVGLFSAFEQKSIGDMPTWLGRIALYIGTVYLTAAILSSNRRVGGTDRASAWASTFRANREQLEALFSNLLDAFIYGKIVLEQEGKPVDWIFLDVNDSYGRVVGLKRDQIIGKRVSEFYPDEHNDPVDWIGKYGHVALTGEPLHFEGYGQSLKKWLHVSSYSPKKGYFVAIFEDITERKKAEKSLKDSQSQLRTIFDSTPDGIVLFDENFRYVEANLGAATIYGVPRDQLIGKSVTEFTEPSFKTEEAVSNFLETGHYFSEDKIMHPDGTFSIVESFGTANVLPGRHLFINHDITERKKAEEAVERQASLIDLSPDAIMVREIDGTITFWSKGAEKLYGFSANEAQGKVSHTLLKTQFPISLDKILQQLESSGSWQGELIHKTKAGQEVIVQSHWLFEKTGEKPSILESNIDITERKKAEEALDRYSKNLETLVEQRTKQLKDSERLAAIGATAGMVGHDIRNPLQAITSDLYLVKTDLASIPEGEEKRNIKESLEEIEENIFYVNKIVADLQDFARPLEPKLEEIDFEQTVHSALAHLNIPGNVTIKHVIGKDFPKLKSDQAYLQRILTNLANNSIQALPNGGKVTIKAVTLKGKAIISVEDNGEGIPENVRGKLFTPLTTTKSKGQGFGLSVVKRFTEALGGTVTFESEVGKGTKFTIELPL